MVNNDIYDKQNKLLRKHMYIFYYAVNILRMRGYSGFPPLPKNMHVKLIGDSKFDPGSEWDGPYCAICHSLNCIFLRLKYHIAYNLISTVLPENHGCTHSCMTFSVKLNGWLTKKKRKRNPLALQRLRCMMQLSNQHPLWAGPSRPQF